MLRLPWDVSLLVLSVAQCCKSDNKHASLLYGVFTAFECEMHVLLHAAKSKRIMHKLFENEAIWNTKSCNLSQEIAMQSFSTWHQELQRRTDCLGPFVCSACLGSWQSICWCEYLIMCCRPLQWNNTHELKRFKQEASCLGLSNMCETPGPMLEKYDERLSLWHTKGPLAHEAPLYKKSRMRERGSSNPFQNGSLVQNGTPFQNGSLVQNGTPFQNGSLVQNGTPIQNGSFQNSG